MNTPNYFILSVDGNWGPWTSWVCPVTCGSGTQTRTRQCNDPAPAHDGNVCPGLNSETASCAGLPHCPGNNTILLIVDGHGVNNSSLMYLYLNSLKQLHLRDDIKSSCKFAMFTRLIFFFFGGGGSCHQK